MSKAKWNAVFIAAVPATAAATTIIFLGDWVLFYVLNNRKLTIDDDVVGSNFFSFFHLFPPQMSCDFDCTYNPGNRETEDRYGHGSRDHAISHSVIHYLPPIKSDHMYSGSLFSFFYNRRYGITVCTFYADLNTYGRP